ncbi:MAG: phosphatidate cytidylyltransferase [Legionella sp.]|nr:MAG: phosphatidate cytidylyltransferase [Legionella sp.]PJD98084.1 MAG: phosphatidate cytidylyltransferase [Legionella sp.]
MFMQRLITSLVLIPLVLLALFYAPGWLLMGVAILILMAAGRECWHLIPLQGAVRQWGFLVLLLALLWICGYFFSLWLILGLMFWVMIIGAIVTSPFSQTYWGKPGIVAFACLLLLPLFIQSAAHLYLMKEGKAFILYLLCIVWAADTGAYLVGKRWGKHKLIPKVSPGKSWEGALGGLAVVLLTAAIGFAYFKPASALGWFGLAGLLFVISLFGDLFVSMLKRRCHLKDTGQLIPGHGGVLDRLDSVIAALPFFYFGIHYGALIR